MRLTLDEAQTRADNRSNFNFVNEFFMKNDGEENIVKFLFDDVSDIEVHGVHVVRMTSKSGQPYLIHVDCLGENCPLCKEAVNHKDEKMPLVSRVRDNIYMPMIVLYDYEGKFSPQYKVFVRTTNYYKNTLAPYIKRNDIKSLCNIERVGAKGSTRTAYNLYEAKKDFKGIMVTDSKSELYPFATKSVAEVKEDFGVQPDDICGRTDSLIRTWTPEMVELFLENPSVYPNPNAQDDDIPFTADEPPRRRTSNHAF